MTRLLLNWNWIKGSDMSKLKELIQKYCPNGVDYVKIQDVCDVFTGGEVPDGSIKSDVPQGEMIYPIWGNGKDVYGYAKTYKISKDAVCVSSIGANTGDVFFHKAFFTPIIRLKVLIPQDDRLSVRFLYYALSSIDFEVKKSSVPNMNANEVKQKVIPFPPLPVQEEIVRILDTFTELQPELQAELQKREQQYEYYQDLLLNKSQFSHLVPIGDMCEIKKGNTPIQKAKEGVYPLVVTTMERRSSDTYQFNASAVCIPLISSRGHGVASLNHVYYQEGKFALGNILCAVIPHDEKVLKAKFLYYYLEYAKDFTLVPLMKGGANVSMHCSDIEKVKIPLPSLDEQERIITILDKFDTLTTDLTVGLPAEIEKRRQQFDYYRDKLLTFKRKET